MKNIIIFFALLFSINLSAQLSVNDSGEIELVPIYKLNTPHNIAKYKNNNIVVLIGGKGQITRAESAQRKGRKQKTGKKITVGQLKQEAKKQNIEVPKNINISELVAYLEDYNFDFSVFLKRKKK